MPKITDKPKTKQIKKRVDVETYNKWAKLPKEKNNLLDKAINKIISMSNGNSLLGAINDIIDD